MTFSMFYRDEIEFAERFCNAAAAMLGLPGRLEEDFFRADENRPAMVAVVSMAVDALNESDVLLPSGLAAGVKEFADQHADAAGGAHLVDAAARVKVRDWSRFWDDLGLVAHEDYVPTSVHALLDHLHLDDAPRSTQEAAIRQWLRDHPAGPVMTYTLERNGFGHLLNE
jgi:hypothetical protein